MTIQPMWCPRTIPAQIVLLIFVTCPPAWAALGGSPGGIAMDHQPLVGEIHTVTAPGYSVQELTTQDLVVREYVSPGGIVFAVSWAGRRSPDLPALFGSYFEQYAAASANRDPKRSPLRGITHIETPQLVVETGGPMGAVWGKAYLPLEFPSGLTKEAIR